MGEGADGLSVLERLQATNDSAEIWWDSPPADFARWSRKLLATAPDERTRGHWSDQLGRFLNQGGTEDCLARGVTTNPSLITRSIIADPRCWEAEVINQARKCHRPDVESVFQRVYTEAVRRAAQHMQPMWEAGDGRYGWVSAQVDPRYLGHADRMIEQGLRLAEVAPNVMVKVPGCEEGYRTIRDLVAHGISVNGTLSFTVPQFLACIEAIEDGLAEARRNGIDLTRWRAVITHMIGRVGADGDLQDEAAARGFDLTQNDVRWAELAILKHIQSVISVKHHPVKMLLSSLAVDDPALGATTLSMHVEQTAGTDLAYTCKPAFIEALMRRGHELTAFDQTAGERPVPEPILEKLARLPSFRRAMDPDGMRPDEFAGYGAFIATYAEVSTNTRRLIDFVARQLEHSGIGERHRPLRPVAA